MTGTLRWRLVGVVCAVFASAALFGGIAASVSSATITKYAAAGDPVGITAGPDGNLWFAELHGDNVGRVTTAGVGTEFPIGATTRDVAAGPDNNLWFTEWEANKIAKVTTAGVATEFTVTTAGSSPYDIAAGPDTTCGSPSSTRTRSPRSRRLV